MAGNFFESKPLQILRKAGEKVGSNKAVNAITSGMMGCIGIIMVGSVFQIIATVLNLIGVCAPGDALYTWFTTPFNMTLGLLSVFLSFVMGYQYSKNLGMKPLPNGLISLALFLLVAAPVQSITVGEGQAMSVLSNSYLGATGMFTAILISLVSVRINYFCEKKNIAIKMPDAVPQFLTDAFSSMIPLFINVVLWHGINTLLLKFMLQTLPGAISQLLALPLSGLISVPGMFVLVFISLVLWAFGIHGTGIIMPILLPSIVAAYMGNAALVAAGQPAEFSPAFLFGAAAACGGTGNVLALAFLSFRSKSKQLKAVGRAGIIPAIFNIGEPMIFGAPIMYNPILMIPFVIGPLLSMLLVYIGYMIGFFQYPYIFVMTTLPVIATDFANTLAWQNLFIAPLIFVLELLVFLPFFKTYEKQLCDKEAAAAAEA